MARLIRMDHTGHTTLAEWTAADAGVGRGGGGGVPRAARRGLLRRGQRRARAAPSRSRELPRRRRARDPAPPDRGRVSAEAPPETAAVHWRPRRWTRRGCALYARSWTVDDGRPGRADAARPPSLLLSLDPLTVAVGVILLAHAWAIPELYANRGAKVVKPRPRAARPAGARPRSACSATSSATRRASCTRAPGWCSSAGALGVWLVGEAGALLVRGAAACTAGACACRTRAAVRRPHRAPAARAARGRAGLRDRGQPRLRGARWRVRRRLPKRDAPGARRRGAHSTEWTVATR